jgi:hypothetical protein
MGDVCIVAGCARYRETFYRLSITSTGGNSDGASFCCGMTKDTLNWSDTTCLVVYLMLCTTLLYCCFINECVPRRLSS